MARSLAISSVRTLFGFRFFCWRKGREGFCLYYLITWFTGNSKWMQEALAKANVCFGIRRSKFTHVKPALCNACGRNSSGPESLTATVWVCDSATKYKNTSRWVPISKPHTERTDWGRCREGRSESPLSASRNFSRISIGELDRLFYGRNFPLEELRDFKKRSRTNRFKFSQSDNHVKRLVIIQETSEPTKYSPAPTIPMANIELCDTSASLSWDSLLRVSTILSWGFEADRIARASGTARLMTGSPYCS